MRSTIISVTIAAGMGLSVVVGAVASTSSLSSQPVSTPQENIELAGYHGKGYGHGKKRWGHAHRHCHGYGCHWAWHWHWGKGGGHHGNWGKWH